MAQLFKKVFFLVLFILFFTFISFFYFSEENIKKINKSRLSHSTKEENNFDLPILSSDTSNIIIYSDEVENYKKKKKRYNFFDLIKNQSDE